MSDYDGDQSEARRRSMVRSDDASHSTHLPAQRGSGVGMGLFFMTTAMVIAVLPWLAEGLLDLQVNFLSQALFGGFGLFRFLAGMVIVVITRLYRKTSADEAFVRTGMGG